MPRMQILTAAEQQAFDTLPIFSDAERVTFFEVSASLHAVLATLRSPTNRVCFVLTVGYFRVAQRFFVPPFPAPDVAYVVQQLGYPPAQIDLEAYDVKASASRHRRLTLDYLGFRPFTEQVAQEMAQEIRAMVRSQLRPKIIFVQLLTLLESRKTEIPSAYTLTELITHTSHQHQHQLTQTLEAHLSPAHRALLDTLFDKQEALWPPEPQVQRYKLTLLKRFAQSTKPSSIKANIEDLRVLRPLYQELDAVVEALDLTPEGVRYYATAVLKTQIFQVARRAEADRYLYLVCFIVHQFLRLHDGLVDILLLAVQSTRSVCEREYKEQYYAGRTEQRQALQTFVADVRTRLGTPLAAIETIAFNPQLTDTEKVTHIQAILAHDQAPRRLVEAQLLEDPQSSPDTNEDAAYHAVLASKSLKLQNRVAEIGQELGFQGEEQGPLLSAIEYYQHKEGRLTQAAPVACFALYEQQVLMDTAGKLRVSLYKALLFCKIADAITAGTVHLKNSYKYRAFDAYLILKTRWEAHRDDYVRRADLLTVADGAQTLETLATALDAQYQHTNDHLLQGANPYFHRHKDRSFHLATPATQADDRVPLHTLLPAQPYISLVELLSTVNRLTGFLDAFEPWQVKYARPRPPEKTFLAGVVGYGCFIGIGKMARISKWINATELETTVNGYFTLDNLHGANDRLLTFMDQLELPEVYRRHAGRLHTSSDGQKYSVAVESLNATYSFKYLGKEAGVSAYTFIDERHFLWHHAVISAAEREAAYVIDGLMHNDVVQSDMHSTDTHGYSEMIFGVLHLLGFAFAPRIKGLKHQHLYSFRPRRVYAQQGYELLPDGYIKTALITPHWDEILRFIATIKLKEATASQLFRRLNSYAKHHPLYQALKEFGKILKSDFLLRFIDDVTLRQAIEKQLNKGENANQFSKAISFGNHHAFLYGEKVEQELAEGCRRLIKNAIICWNDLYLSQKIAQEPDAERRQALLAAVRQGSVASWHHVNLHGEYDFSDEKMQDSVGLHTPSAALGIRPG
jgi:TnpA family transposase